MDIATELERKKTRRRTRFLALIVAFWVLAILVRLVQIQAFGHAAAKARVTTQSREELPIRADRGTIYDRKGRILAQSIPSKSVFVQPSPGGPKEAHFAPVRAAAPILGLDRDAVAQKLRQIEMGKNFVYLKREVEPGTVRRLTEAKIQGLQLQEEPRRYYPHGTLAAHVLGGVDTDERGLAGIELRYNGVLGGREGRRLVLRDALRREYNVETMAEPKPGKDISLTLDLNIQYFAQSELEKAMALHEAEWGTVIVGVPATGEILAMAGAPVYNPNAFASAPAERMIDWAVRTQFDPGSTFKIVTAAAALEHGRVGLSETFNCAADAITVPGGPIRDHKAFGVLSFADVFTHSSNIGTIQVARRLGPDLFFRMVQAFRFGLRTGIDLPAEAAGLVHPPNEWSRRSLDAMSVGYEVSVTAIQLLQAMNCIANRGELVPPRLLKSIDGRPVADGSAAERTRVLSATAAETLVGMLERVVLDGTGQPACPPGYTAAGKTGTAQLVDRDTRGYTSEKHLAAFAGFAPAEAPVLSIVVVICDPKKQDLYYGGLVAAPIFREVATRALRYLQVYPRPRPATILAARNREGGRP